MITLNQKPKNAEQYLISKVTVTVNDPLLHLFRCIASLNMVQKSHNPALLYQFDPEEEGQYNKCLGFCNCYSVKDPMTEFNKFLIKWIL